MFHGYILYSGLHVDCFVVRLFAPDYYSCFGFLVGPCALDYTRVKTADNYWTDPPAEELLQRHRIQGTTIARTDSPKRPGLQVDKISAIILLYSLEVCLTIE